MSRNRRAFIVNYALPALLTALALAGSLWLLHMSNEPDSTASNGVAGADIALWSNSSNVHAEIYLGPPQPMRQFLTVNATAPRSLRTITLALSSISTVVNVCHYAKPRTQGEVTTWVNENVGSEVSLVCEIRPPAAGLNDVTRRSEVLDIGFTNPPGTVADPRLASLKRLTSAAICLSIYNNDSASVEPPLAESKLGDCSGLAAVPKGTLRTESPVIVSFVDDAAVRRRENLTLLLGVVAALAGSGIWQIVSTAIADLVKPT